MDVARDPILVSRSCVIDAADLEWRFSGSGGPGGQHANTANTRVELLLDLRVAQSLGPRQRARLLEHFGPVVRVVASDSRSQARNRDLARERLGARLAEALRVRKGRIATKPSRSAKKTRLQNKRKRGDLKVTRARPNRED
ncbi:MAG: aminoacyl-tRNA hydrolase [Acidimicrobiia bacterium]|nr:aminoacyl-tRNA hydrolase [Acidimicrobiia bacterium]